MRHMGQIAAHQMLRYAEGGSSSRQGLVKTGSLGSRAVNARD
jgi:hypothetical protein